MPGDAGHAAGGRRCGGAGSLTVTTQPECAGMRRRPRLDLCALARIGARLGNGLIPSRRQRRRLVARRRDRRQWRTSARVAACAMPLRHITHELWDWRERWFRHARIATAADCAWTALPDVTWITVVSPAAGSGDGSVGFAVAPNRDDTRSGSIVVGNQRIVVTQASGVTPPPPAPPPPTPPGPPSPTCSYSLPRGSDFVKVQARVVAASTYHNEHLQVERREQCRMDLRASGATGTRQRQRRIPL